MSDIQKAVFIRHKMGSTPDILEDLWCRREIAIHYKNLRSTNPDDYKEQAAKNALKRLHNYCKTGAVVGAVYKKIRPAHILVGTIPAGSTVQSTDRYGETFIYKVVQLQDVKEIALADYPLLGAIQPRLTTITGWPAAFNTLRNIAFGKSKALDVNSLAPGQLEVLCHEYLRARGILKALLLPIGRNLQDVDIFGIGDDGGKVLAQVTHSDQLDKVDSKLEILKSYKGPGIKLIFFGPKTPRIIDGDVSYMAIEDVFADLKSSQETVYRQMVEMMCK